MKIAQFQDAHGIGIGVIEKDTLQPLGFDGDMIDFLAGERDLAPRGEPVPLEGVRLLPPLSRPSKIMALGLNYRDHAEEQNARLPEVPLIFAKFPNSLIGQGDPICWDDGVTAKVDYEAELAVIIGSRVRNCPEKESMEAVFGYTCANDVSARDLQFGDRQWVRGKSLDTFCPLGPWVVTTDEIPDPHVLGIRSELNGATMQDSNTEMLIFNIPFLVSFLSRHFTLFPGDIILTGTPSGVGNFRTPPVYMKDGDEVTVEIEGIGRLSNTCRVG